jgi:SAM-dependent methyltransferase
MSPSGGSGYDDLYAEFDSDLMRRLRAEAYGSDIGQHSWVTEQELIEDISSLSLTPASRVLDLGCGPGGPLTFIVKRIGCAGVGADVSAPAIAAGRARAASLGLEELVELQEWDLNEPIPLPAASFDAVLSLDVILHLRDRGVAFREVARLVSPGGRFLFTDAGIVTGVVTDEEVRRRTIHGYTRLVPPGFNEDLLEEAGFSLLCSEDRTPSLLKNATGRLAARNAHRAEIEARESKGSWERQQTYLETVIELARRGAVSRMMYLAAAPKVRP